MSKISFDLSVPFNQLSIRPADGIFRGNVLLFPSTRSFRVLPILGCKHYSFPMSYGCIWSKCVRDNFITCSKCPYNIVVL